MGAIEFLPVEDFPNFSIFSLRSFILNSNYLKNQLSKIFNSPISELTITPLAGDASTRRYYRLASNNNSVVLMELGENNHEQGELFFKQQKMFMGIGLPVPKIYFYDNEKCLMFLEDCGDFMLQDIVKQNGITCCCNYYKRAINIILKLQVSTFKADNGHKAFSWAFDVEKFTFELNFFLKHLIENIREVSPQERDRFDFYFNNLAQILAGEPRYLTHRDYHSRNIMVNNGQLTILDFQDARLGLCQYDLASLLRDSYVTLPDEMIDELLNYYISQSNNWGIPLPHKDYFYKIFIFTCIQRNLKALGTFGYQAMERNNKNYLPYIPVTLGYLRKNLYIYDEFTGLGELLSTFLPELKR